MSKDSEGKLMCKPIFSKIVSLFAEHNDLQYAAPGGLIGKDVLLWRDLLPNAYWKPLFVTLKVIAKWNQKAYKQFSVNLEWDR